MYKHPRFLLNQSDLYVTKAEKTAENSGTLQQ